MGRYGVYTGVVAYQKLSKWAQPTSWISDTKRVCKHRSKHFPCCIVFIIYTLRLLFSQGKLNNSVEDTPCNFFYSMSTSCFRRLVSQRHSSFKLSINYLFRGLPFFHFVNLLQTVQQINYKILVHFSWYCWTELLLDMFSLIKILFNTPSLTSLLALFFLTCSCSPKFRYILPKTCRLITFVFLGESRFSVKVGIYNCRKLFSFAGQWPV